MRLRRRLGVLLAASALVATASRAAAQSADPYATASTLGRLSFGGEFSAVVAPRDDRAFFNYTDYEVDSLRLARVRLLGEWRALARLSIVGELRVENADTTEAAALFVRWRPFGTAALEVQAGRIPTVIGAFPRRAYGRDNAVLGVPLAYQYLTSLRPDALPATVDDLLRMRGRGWQPSYPIGSTAVATGLPLVSSTKWDTGIEATWRHAWLEAAGAFTRGSPAAPVVHDNNDGHAWSGRVAATLPGGVVLGTSAARGQWIDDDVLKATAAGVRTPASQSVFGIDGEYGFEHWLVRAEWLQSAFDVPFVLAHDPDRRLTAHSAYGELRYRPRPRWQVGGRVERLLFGPVYGAYETVAAQSWDAPVTRVEASVGFRLTRHVDVRGGWQQDWRPAGRVHRRGYPAAGVLLWF